MNKETDNSRLYAKIKRDVRGFLLCLSLALVACSVFSGDSKDKSFWDRSGMYLRVDSQTGLHYLEGSSGGLTPRMAKDGTHFHETDIHEGADQ